MFCSPLRYRQAGSIIRCELNKKLSCRRETARRFVSLNILLSDSSSFEMTLLSRARVSPYYHFIETRSLCHTVSGDISKNGVTLKLGVRVVQGF